jgi:Ca2+-binding RTX toxin-like protein
VIDLLRDRRKSFTGTTTMARIFFAIALVLVSLVAMPAAAAPEGPIDLLSEFDIRIDGAGPPTLSSVASSSVVDGAGDVNGDGTPDSVISTQFNYDDNNSRQDSGSVYVVFGNPSADTVDLASLGSDGFRIDGAAADDHAGESAAIAGDVNDDGLDDVIVGAPDADNNTRAGSGSAYVVFGKATTTNVDLASLDTAGFRIDGNQSGDAAGRSVEGGGDVNGDGIDDVLLGTTGHGTGHGAVYVVFGSESPTNVDLLSYTSGFLIAGAAVNDLAGADVANAGDVNNDDLDDIVLGAPQTDNNSRNLSGSAYVVFGKEDTTTVQLASLDTGGFRIDGAAASDAVARDVDGAGDVNGDGFADVVMNTALADNNSRNDSGSAYVVFGKATTTNVDLASLDTGGFRIDGASEGDQAGSSVATGGDVDNDGRADIVVGATHVDKHSRNNSGSAYVVLGKTTTTNVDLASLGTGGFRIDGAAADDQAGWIVANAGDVDDNGLDDVIVGAPFADNNSRTDSGSAYIELVWLEGDCANPLSGTSGDDTLIGGPAGDDITGGAGADDLSGEEGNDCVAGENGADTVKGGENVDTVTGGDGDDPTVNGGDGNDTLEGGEGDDTMDGGNGTDDAEGGKNVDTIEGGDKGDTLDGGKGDDTLKGEEGDDTLEGSENADTLKGGADEDTLKGGDGGDTLEGGDNADTLKGGDGEDTIEAGSGNDDIDADDGNIDTIKCGSGNDTVDADNNDVLIGC